MTLTEAQAEAVRMLRSRRIDVPDLTARVLLAHVLQRDQAWLVSHSLDELAADRLEALRTSVRQRCDGVPTQYIRGFQEFYGREFLVTPDVLIPRPETEHLVEAALERLRPGHSVADIGTGSGAVAISLAKESVGARIFGSDISLPAVKVARSNAERLQADVCLCAGDLATAFLNERFDLVVSNPPYVPLDDAPGLQRELSREPPVALFGGTDGLQVIRDLLRSVPRVLKPGGWFLCEIGFNSRPGVERLLHRCGWSHPQFLTDLAGIDRVLVVRKAAEPVAE